MANEFDALYDDSNPYVSAGLKRRRQEAARPVQTEIESVDPYAGNWAAETARSVIRRSAADYRYAPEVIARYAFGDEEGARGVARRWQGDLQRAQEVGPAVQDFSQAEDVGGFVSALGYQAANMAPDVVASLTGGGLAGVAAKRGVKRRIISSIADRLESRADNIAAKMADTRIARAEARQLAEAAPGGAEAVSGAVKVAEAQVNERARKAAMQEAARIAGRTPRVDAALERASTWGFRAGATVAGVPTLSETNVERYADEGTSSADANKLLAGTALASLLQSFPLEHLQGRFGTEAAEQIAKKGERFLPRVAKEFGKQGVAEGGQEAAQQAIQLGSQAWMDENWDPLTSEEGRSSILQNAMAGFLLGGVLGAGAETARSTSGVVGSAARASKAAYGKLRDAAREQLTKLAEKARNAEKRRRAGEPMDPEDGPPAGAGGLDLQGFFAKARDLAGKGLDATTTAATGLKDTIAGRFKDIADGRTQAEEIDAVADAFADEMLAMDGKGYPGQLRDPTQNRFQYKTGQQRMMMSFVDESKLDEPTAMKAAAILERLHTGKARGLDFADLQDMRDAGLIRNSTYAAIALAGNERSKYGAQVAEENARDAELGFASERPLEQAAAEGDGTTAMAQAFRRAQEGQEAQRAASDVRDLDDTHEADSEVDAQNWDQGLRDDDAGGAGVVERKNPIDAMLTAQRSLERFSPDAERRAAAGDASGAQLRQYREERDAAHAEAERLQAQIAHELLGDSAQGVKNYLLFQYGNTDAPKSENPKDVREWQERKARADKAFNQRVADPGYVELAEPMDFKLATRTEPRRTLIDLGTMALQQQARLANESAAKSVSPKQALFRGLTELAMAGKPVRPSTITPGRVWTYKQGPVDAKGKPTRVKDRVLFTLTKDDVAQLRADLVEAGKRLGPPSKRATRSPAADEERSNELDEDFLRSLPREQYMGEEEIDGWVDPDFSTQAGAEGLVAREAPPGVSRREPGASRSEFVPEMNVVSSADATNPHAAVLSELRRRLGRNQLVETDEELSQFRALAASEFTARLDGENLALQRLNEAQRTLAIAKATPQQRTRARERAAEAIESSDFARVVQANSLLRRLDAVDEGLRKYGADAYVAKLEAAVDSMSAALKERREKLFSEFRRRMVRVDELRAKRRVTQEYADTERARLREEREILNRERAVAGKAPLKSEVLDPYVTPSEAAQAIHEAGVQIGTAVLTEQNDTGNLNDTALAETLARLNDPTTGLSRQYVNDAARGKFDRARVSNMPEDAMAVDNENRDQSLLPRENERGERNVRGYDGTENKDGTLRWQPRNAAAGSQPVSPEKRRPVAGFERDSGQTVRMPLETDAPPMKSEAPSPQAGGRQTRDILRAVQESTGKPARTKDGVLDVQHGEKRDALGKKYKGATLAAESLPVEVLQNEEIDAGADSATSESGPHDLKAELNMLNAILKAMGITELVRSLKPLAKGRPDKLSGGSYERVNRAIEINPHIHGAERVEVLMHELGHHIIWHEIAKHVEGGFDALKGMSLSDAVAALAKGNPKLYKALKKDFDQWSAAGRGNSSSTFRTLLKETIKGRREFTDDGQAFHEWLADHISRALTQQREPVGIIGEFFGAIATALRKAWQLLSVRKDLKPAKSVDAWMRQLLKAETAAVKAATGVTVTAETADASVRAAAAASAAVNPDDPRSIVQQAIKDTATFVKEVLPVEERQILDRVFGRYAALVQLRKFYAEHGFGDLLKRLDDAKTGMEDRIAMGYIAWQQGAFTPGTEGRKALLTAQSDLLSVLGMAGDTDLAQRVLEDIANGRIERMRKRDQAYSVRELEARARGTRQKALNWLAKEGPVSSALAKFWSSQYSRLHGAGVPALRHLVALIQRPQGTTSDDQDRGLNPAMRLKMARLHTQLNTTLKELDAAQRDHVLDVLQRGAIAGEVAYDKKSPAIRKAVDELRAMTGDVFDYMVAAGSIDPAKRRDNFWPVTLSLTDENAKTRLFKLYNQPEKFEKSIREFFGYWEDEGKPTKGSKRGKGERADLPPVKQEVLDFFARRRNKATGKAAETNANIIEAFKTGDIRALERHIEKANTRLAANDYSQETVEFIELEIRYAKARIAELQKLSPAPAAEAPTTTEAGPGKPKTERKRIPDTESKFEDLVQRLVDGAGEFDGEMRVGASETEVDPAFKGLNHRVSQFIYDHGDANDRHAFAKLQSKDFDEIFARYFAPAVRNAEYTRRFGGGEKNRGKLDVLLAEAKKQGASKEDLELAENAIKAAIGTYGMDGSPTLNAISPALAKRFSGPRTKAFIQGAQAYQNTRLLPLALLSSLVDPMGIAVRSGGDLKETWTGFKDGIRALAKGKEGKELLAMLEEIGAGDEFLPALAAHPVFDGNENAFAKKVNEFVFKWNGMSSWVMATRIMAMTAGHKFLLKHAAAYGTDDTSRRFLDELSLTPADIQEDPAKPGRVVLNDKTKEALRQFVDEAILRPNSTQVPLWHSDPYMGLVTQYKAFGYAIYDQISSRVGRELNHGNFRVMLAALAYLPLALTAELVRELVQYGDEGNPQRKDWGVTDYTALAAERTGLLGPQAAIASDVKGDIGRRELPGTSQLGPTLGQAENAADAFEGRRSLGGEVKGALPASAAWKHRNDGGSEGLQRRNAA